MFWAVLLFTGLTTTAWAQAEPATAWGWMAGSSIGTPVQDPVTPVVDTSGTPGSRTNPIQWTDTSGNFWLFGGYVLDSDGNSSYLNDLWEFTGSSWTYKGGSTSAAGLGCVAGNGTTIVSGRNGAAAWADDYGHLWLFGGYGCSTTTSLVELNDLWELNINNSTPTWTYVGGSLIGNAATTASQPGGREGAVSWTTTDGSFWLFGGNGPDSVGTTGKLNDLWKYNPTAATWTHVTGSLTSDTAGVYGTQGAPAAGNTPGARSYANGAVDSKGTLWLFGGLSTGSLNDLWSFNPSTSRWTWVSGGSVINAQGVYSLDPYTPVAGNLPGARNDASLMADAADNLWLFGGNGYGSVAGSSGDLNDLWEFDVPSSAWTWMGGDKHRCRS